MKKLKILVIPIIIPFPASDGGKICTLSFIEKLQNINDFTLVLQAYNEVDCANIELLKKAIPNVNIITVKGFQSNPQKTKHSLKNKIKDLINFFLRIIIKIKPERQSEIYLLDNIDRTTPFLPKSRKYIESLNLLFNEIKFDIIQVEYTENINLINCLPNNVKKIYVEIESRYSVLNDFANLKIQKSLFDTYVCNNTKMLELSYLSKYDAILSLSEKDSERLKIELPNNKIFTSPFSVSDDNIQKIELGNFKLEKLVFIGPEEHFPNKDAVLFFLKEVYTKFDFSIPIFIIGNWCNETKILFSTDKIIFVGYVENINNFLKNSIMVVPIRLGGGGLRTKILLAMAQGVPIVSTTLGADGFDFVNRKHFLDANTPLEFYSQINFLNTNNEIAFNIAKNAQDLFQEKYSQQLTADIRNQIYHNIVLNA